MVRYADDFVCVFYSREKAHEFYSVLQKRLKENVDALKEKGIVREDGRFTLDAVQTAALFLIEEEFKEQPREETTQTIEQEQEFEEGYQEVHSEDKKPGLIEWFKSLFSTTNSSA